VTVVASDDAQADEIERVVQALIDATAPGDASNEVVGGLIEGIVKGLGYL
jgi:hypothetical protein